MKVKFIIDAGACISIIPQRYTQGMSLETIFVMLISASSQCILFLIEVIGNKCTLPNKGIPMDFCHDAGDVFITWI